MQTEQASTIAKLNDEFRKKGFAVTVTTGVQALPDLAGLLEAVREYNEFWDANDPYGEHDFGTIVWANKKVFWKIDYYDAELKYWCDPVTPGCNRILTVMLAAEY
jgi:hypothetical protein